MKLIGIALLLSAAFSHQVLAGDKEREAEAAVNAWIALVDAGKYAQSWESAASLFRGQVEPKQWEAAVASARKPFGPVKNRKLIKETYATSLPGAPDGEYVVFQYKTEFENKAAAVETITPMLDDGVWRVSGYFVR